MTAIDQARYDVEALREQQFPITKNTVYLNSAAIAPIPQRTFDMMRIADEKMLLEASGAFETWMFPRLEEFKEQVRGLINARETVEIVGVSSTSLGLNLVAQAMKWEKGQNIVLCDVEFPSNVYPWMRLQEQYGVGIRIIPHHQGGLTLDSLAAAIDSNTALVAVSAIQFLTGHKSDLKALGAFCKEHNILFAVDAIQAAGHMPIDVQAMNIDILSSGGQKSLMGPMGFGFLYVRRDLAEQMQPTIVSAISVDDWMHWLRYNLTPAPVAERFATGSFNMTGMIGLTESIKLLREIGIAAIESHMTTLAMYAYDQLTMAGYEVISPRDFSSRGPIITFRAAETDETTMQIMNTLKSQRIFTTKHWDVNGDPHIRISFHCFNNLSDINRLMDALQERQR